MTITLSVEAHTLRQFDANAPLGHYWYRFDWTPPSVNVTASSPPPVGAARAPSSSGAPSAVTRVPALRWTATNAAGSAVGSVDPANPRRYVLPRPSGPDRVRVSCREGSSAAVEIVIWFIRGSVSVRGSGARSPDNEAWSSALSDLHLSGSPQLGPLVFQPTHDATKTAYGGLIEIVGRIEPHDVPSRFYLTRHRDESWIQRYASDGSPVGPPVELPPADDTSDADEQDQTLSSAGNVFDVDAPGSDFGPDAQTGDYEIYHARFRETVAIGSLPRDAWAQTLAQATALCDAQPWHFDARLTVQRAGTPPTVSLNRHSLDSGAGPGRFT